MEDANTHTYDGKLRGRLLSFHPFFVEAASRSFEDKSKMFDSICEELKFCSPTSLLYIKRIKQDMFSKSFANYDPTNDVYADDILWICGKILSKSGSTKKDFLKELSLNLEDMISGDCSQGRTTRLLQVMFAFEEYLLAP